MTLKRSADSIRYDWNAVFGAGVDNIDVGACEARGITVVHTPDATLVMPRKRAEDVKGLVAELKALGRPEGEMTESVDRRINRAADILARQVLFSEEAALPAPMPMSRPLVQI